MAGRKEMDLTTGRPFGSLLRFAVPVILGPQPPRAPAAFRRNIRPGDGCERLKNRTLFTDAFHGLIKSELLLSITRYRLRPDAQI